MSYRLQKALLSGQEPDWWRTYGPMAISQWQFACDDGTKDDDRDERDESDHSEEFEETIPAPVPFAALPTARLRGEKDNDILDLVTWEIKRVDGRKGSDIVDLGNAYWHSDLAIDGSDMILSDRFSDQETRLRNIEQVRIGGQVFDVDTLAETLNGNSMPLLFSDGLSALKVNIADPTPSVLWDQVAQFLVMETKSGPTNAARIFAMVHTAIYDAYAAHDARALRVSIDPAGDNVETFDAKPEDIETAMHHAGHAVLRALFPDHGGLLDRIMEDRLDLSLDESHSASAQIGLDAAGDILRLRPDAASEVDAGNAAFYIPVNPHPGEVTSIDSWTPELRKTADGTKLQSFLSPEFPLLEPFALPQMENGGTDFAAIRPPAPEPFFLDGFADAKLDIAMRTVTLSSAAVIGGKAFAAGDILSVTRDLVGEVINPSFIAQAERLIEISANLTTQDRAIAEFWEDGPGTSYPPGTMMTLAQFVSERDGHDAATDAHLFLAMGNAMFDAAIAAWDAKVHYDYARPVQVIRDLGELGLIGTPGIDAVTGETGNVITAFAGFDPDTGASLGTRTILAENFVTYQDPSGDFSPPFAEYVSGHSTFSGAAAAVLKAFTGENVLGASTTLPVGGSGFDPTFPETALVMSWPDFDTAALEAGMSRIFGGIHFDDGNEAGLALGGKVGDLAAELAAEFANGSAAEEEMPFSDWFAA